MDAEDRDSRWSDNGADGSIADVVMRISENASTLIREEVELAKAEIELKIRRITRGAVVAAAAGFFVLLALIFGFQALAWGLNDIFSNAYGWLGFAIVTGLLLALAGLAAFVAIRSFKAGTPPTPDLALEEAKLIREALEHPDVQAAAEAGVQASRKADVPASDEGSGGETAEDEG